MSTRAGARFVLCWSASISVLAAGARGEIIPVSTERTLSYEISVSELGQPGQSDTQTVTGPETGAWSRTISGRLNPAVFTFLQAGAEAEQSSSITPQQITASTRIRLIRQQDGSNGLGATVSRARSALRFTFDVTTPTPVVFDASVSRGDFINEWGIVAILQRSAPGVTENIAIAADPRWWPNQRLTAHYEGTLQPGRYMVEAVAAAGISDPSRGALRDLAFSADMSLTFIPAPTPALALAAAGVLVSMRRRRDPR